MAMADNIVMSEMTWTEVDEAMKDRPVGILPVGAIEANGPHLPLNADTVIAIEMVKRGAPSRARVSALILPPVSFTVSDFAAKFSDHWAPHRVGTCICATSASSRPSSSARSR
jgi:creatinine amidohydrolase